MSGTGPSWRDTYKVHPAADIFPMMSEAELRELGEDIKKNGLKEPVTVLYGEGDEVLLDGRNRLDAMELVGLSPIRDGQLAPAFFTAHRADGARIGGNPYSFVLSANIHRRHLTAEKKRELIAKVIAANPEKSDRQIAAETKTSHPTVARVRDTLEQAGDVEKVSTRTDTKGRAQPAHKSGATWKVS